MRLFLMAVVALPLGGRRAVGAGVGGAVFESRAHKGLGIRLSVA
jgi:hypothetical protein